jgi:hypothetical protein
MAGNGIVLLQVSEFTLAGIDNTRRKIIVEGQAIVAEAVNSLATLTIVAGGSGWVANDLFTLPGGTGGVGKVATVTGSAAATVSISSAGYGYTAATGAAATAVLPSSGTGLTITTTVTAGAAPILITGWKIVSNVLTFTAANSLTTGGGQAITVTGFTGAMFYLNGTYTTSSATATTIVVPLTAPNASGTQYALAVLQPNYTTGGLPISYNFIGVNGTSRPIAGIGPLSTPNPIQFTTMAGSAFNYGVNVTGTPNLMKISSGVTEVSNGAAVTADTIRFRAEFANQGF